MNVSKDWFVLYVCTGPNKHKTIVGAHLFLEMDANGKLIVIALFPEKK